MFCLEQAQRTLQRIVPYVMSPAGDVERCQSSDVGIINVFDDIVIHIQGAQGFLHVAICITPH